jgi:hypothetical protein
MDSSDETLPRPLEDGLIDTEVSEDSSLFVDEQLGLALSLFDAIDAGGDAPLLTSDPGSDTGGGGSNTGGGGLGTVSVSLPTPPLDGPASTAPTGGNDVIVLGSSNAGGGLGTVSISLPTPPLDGPAPTVPTGGNDVIVLGGSPGDDVIDGSGMPGDVVQVFDSNGSPATSSFFAGSGSVGTPFIHFNRGPDAGGSVQVFDGTNDFTTVGSAGMAGSDFVGGSRIGGGGDLGTVSISLPVGPVNAPTPAVPTGGNVVITINGSPGDDFIDGFDTDGPLATPGDRIRVFNSDGREISGSLFGDVDPLSGHSSETGSGTDYLLG